VRGRRRGPPGNGDPPAHRFVKDLISFNDPVGDHLEAFHGPAIAGEPFRAVRSIATFRTGALGPGHVAFHVKNIDDLRGCHRDLPGLAVTDYITPPFRTDLMHVNPRHHSVALIETGKQDLHHLMGERFSLDGVGLQGRRPATGPRPRLPWGPARADITARGCRRTSATRPAR
jgi:hypothetical protein